MAVVAVALALCRQSATTGSAARRARGPRLAPGGGSGGGGGGGGGVGGGGDGCGGA